MHGISLSAALVTLAACVSYVSGASIDARQTNTLKYCGSQPYYPKDYTCYPANNNLLCPILGGVIYLPCATACYDPSNYGCANGRLYLVGNCGGTPFDKNSYVCVDGFLCPKTAPNKCGTACYNLAQYYCDNGVLKQQGH